MTIIQPGYADCSVELRHTLMSRSAFITFGVNPASGDATDVAVAVSASIVGSNSLRSMWDNETIYKTLTVRLGQDGGEPTVGTVTANVTGLAAGQVSLPPNCAVLVHKKTAVGGRRHRGRMYMPWSIGEANVDEAGMIGSAFVSGLQTNVNNFLNLLETNQVPMVILHSIGKTPVPSATPVTALQLDPLLATQRRRLAR